MLILYFVLEFRITSASVSEKIESLKSNLFKENEEEEETEFIIDAKIEDNIINNNNINDINDTLEEYITDFSDVQEKKEEVIKEINNEEQTEKIQESEEQLLNEELDPENF